MIVDVVLKLARRAGYVTEKEKRFDNDGLSADMRKLKPDAVMVSPDPSLKPLMLDVGVTHPCAKSNVRQASLPTGRLDAARGMLDDKRRKYVNLANIIGYRFVGLIIETYGGMVDEFRMLIDGLVDEAQDHQQLSIIHAKQLKVFTYGAIAVALHRGNGLLARRLYQVPSVEDISFSDYSHHAPILAVGAWGA
jgi:anthranilate/para-aminobenzoate synthase component II